MSHRMIAASALAAGLALGPAAPLHAQTLMEEMADEAAWEEQREAAPKVCFAVPASAGFQTRSGARQSMPSISMASCAGVNVIAPS